MVNLVQRTHSFAPKSFAFMVTMADPTLRVQQRTGRFRTVQQTENTIDEWNIPLKVSQKTLAGHTGRNTLAS